MVYYDVPLKAYSRRDRYNVSLGYYNGFTFGIPWDEAQGTWKSGDPFNEPWDIPWRQLYLPEGIPNILYGTEGGRVEVDYKTELSDELFTWESKDIILAHGSRFTEFRYLVKGNPFQVRYSYNSGGTWTQPVTLTPSIYELEEVIDYVNTTQFKVRIRIQTVGRTFELAWIEPWTIAKTRSTGVITGEPPT
jgi:hypothetical protein